LRSGGGDGIHVSGYEESQSPFLSSVVAYVIDILEKKTIDGIPSNNVIVDIKAIILAFILSCHIKS
jgi:hypothetical protein